MRAEPMPSSWPTAQLRVRAAQLPQPSREILRRDSEPVARWAAALAEVDAEIPLREVEDDAEPAPCTGCDRCSGRKTVARGVRAKRGGRA